MTDPAALPAEFSMIFRHLRPLAGPSALGLTDDAAVLDVPPGRSLVVAADALVQGVHFLPDDAADLVARKLLRTNLSDLAAMGAVPLGYLTTIAVPRATPDAWFAAFAAGLATDQALFGLHLLGGDTTSTTGPVVLSLTILGTVALGTALRRDGARDGDGLWVSGTIGDGALGLLAARGELADPDGFLADRYRLPQPRLALGQALVGIARAAMDVSDGLVQDVGHLCRASHVGALIEAATVPLSPAAHAAVAGTGSHLALCFTGGDDYELAVAVPSHHADAARALGLVRIGCFAAGPPVVRVVAQDGRDMALAAGWDHLASQPDPR